MDFTMTNMIAVTVGNNYGRKTISVPDDMTVRACLESAEIDYSRGTINMDGATIQPGMLDRTFKDLGIKEKCFLFSITKADNAR